MLWLFAVKAAEAWKKATDEEKAPHAAAAEQEKEVYERLSAEYQEKKEAATKQEAQALARTFMTSQVAHANSKDMLSAINIQEDFIFSHEAYHLVLPHHWQSQVLAKTQAEYFETCV